MPKRTNLFQEVVEIIHRHMAGDATVEASAMLPSRTTGALREVDVVIRSETAGYEVIVSVEAVGRSRRADRGWVDQMIEKHRDLPTSKLILVSERGFTKDARVAAIANGAVPLAPEDVSSASHERDVVNALPALWPKVVSFTIEEINVRFAEDAPSEGWDENPPRVFVDVELLGDLMEVVKNLYNARWVELMEQINLADRTEDSIEKFAFVVEAADGEDLQIEVDGVRKTMFVLNSDGRGYSMRRITAVGTGDIKVSKVPLETRRLGEIDVNFAYGEGKFGGRDALLVLSDTGEGESNLTIRVRPVDASAEAGDQSASADTDETSERKKPG